MQLEKGPVTMRQQRIFRMVYKLKQVEGIVLQDMACLGLGATQVREQCHGEDFNALKWELGHFEGRKQY